MSEFYCWQGDDLILDCHLLPKSKTDELVGQHGGQLKIKITAAPVDGKANKHLINLLAKSFKVPKQSISIYKGLLGKDKKIRISAPTYLPAQLKIQRI